MHDRFYEASLRPATAGNTLETLVQNLRTRAAAIKEYVFDSTCNRVFIPSLLEMNDVG